MMRPFHCGSQYADWIERNCNRCWKSMNETRKGSCSLDRALATACFGDGEISDEVAKRIGAPDDCTVYGWDCPEREEQRPYRPRKPRKNEEQLRIL
jgi:hypothetical protein